MSPAPHDAIGRVARDPRADVSYLDSLRQLIRDEVRDAMGERIPPGTVGQVVYFVQAEDGGAIKIGIARFPEKRLAELQATSPLKLRILGTTPGGAVREKALHVQFRGQRLHGEWFDESEELLTLIEEICA